jgi:hypothetical protein
MKLIKFAAAGVFALSSLSASAGLLEIVGGDPSMVIASNNDFKANFDDPVQEYTTGGQLAASTSGNYQLTFDFLGSEALWKNSIFLDGGTKKIDNYSSPGPVTVTQSYTSGSLIDFLFKSVGTNGPGDLIRYLANGSNASPVPDVMSFAIALNATFNGVFYDAVLFLDDTGDKGPTDDDNHDDLIIGIKATVPEPSTVILMLMGLASLFGARRLKA